MWSILVNCVVILIVLTLLACLYDWRRRRVYAKFNVVLGPAFPFVGYLPYLNLDPKKWLTNGIELVLKNPDKPTMLYCGPIDVWLVFQPEVLEIFLSSSKCLVKSDEYSILESWLGAGLLTSSGTIWRRHRKILTPAFHYGILDDYISLFDHAGNILIQKLSKEVDAENVNVFNYATRFTLDVICETAMGVSIRAQEGCHVDYVQAVKEMCNIFFYRNCRPHYRVDFIYRLSKLYKEEKKYLNVINDLCNKVIRERMQMVAGKLDNNKSDHLGAKRRYNLLDVLIASDITHKEMLDEVNTFVFEGHDTTSATLSFALYELSKNPVIQQKAYNEVKSILSAEKINLATLNSMKYLEMVIKETLRKYPGVPLFSRKLNEDFVYEEGKILPKGLMLWFPVIALHHNPNLYPAPEKFDPERFTQEENSKRHPYAYLPFSAGPRNCIGQKFAMLELKTALSKILLNYELVSSDAPEVEVLAKITLQSTTGFNIRLKLRNQN